MAEIINNELNKYWSFLDSGERKRFLGLIKAFVQKKEEKDNTRYSEEYTPEFFAEMDRRYEDYLASGKTYTTEEVLDRIVKGFAEAIVKKKCS